MLLAGLTGNYGMGKSSVLGMFKYLGAVTLSADEIVKTLLGDEAVLSRIRSELADDFFFEDGTLDRAKAAAVIFSDQAKRNAIENILHPIVFQRIEDFIDRVAAEDRHRVVVVEIPLLFETESSKRFDKTITVYADEDIVFKRLEKTGVSRDDAIIRLNAQMPVKEKVGLSDFAIDNNGALDETRTQVREIYERLSEDTE